jgi:hypothetical protein
MIEITIENFSNNLISSFENKKLNFTLRRSSYSQECFDHSSYRYVVYKKEDLGLVGGQNN